MWGGVLVLARSLQLVKSSEPFYVLVPANKRSLISTGDCKKYGITIIEADDIQMPVESNRVSYWSDTVFKLNVFGMTQFKKIVFLDSDMLVMKNIDHLFEKEHMSAVSAGAILHTDWENQLNSGIMVIEPSRSDYCSLIDLIKDTYIKRKEMGCGFGDQDVIKAKFSDWSNRNELHMPETYNCMLGYGELLKKAGIINGIEDIYVYHYTGKEKPWRNKKEQMIIYLKMLKRNKAPFYSVDLACYRKYLSVLKEIARD